MPPGGGQLVLLDHPHLPISVLHVLAKEGGERAPWAVPAPDCRALPDPAATAHDAQVVLVILVAHQFLVKITETLKPPLSPATVGYRVHISFVIHHMKSRSPDRKRRMVSGRHRAFHVRFRFGSGGPSDIVRPGRLEQLHAAFDVIRSILRVGIHPDDNVRLGKPDRQIQTNRNNSAWIIKHADSWLITAELFQEFSRTIVRHPVRDYDLKAPWRFLLLQDGAHAAPNMIYLIPAG